MITHLSLEGVTFVQVYTLFIATLFFKRFVKLIVRKEKQLLREFNIVTINKSIFSYII